MKALRIGYVKKPPTEGEREQTRGFPHNVARIDVCRRRKFPEIGRFRRFLPLEDL
jgi:hypothetical protein